MQDFTFVFNVTSDNLYNEPLYVDQVVTIPAETVQEARGILSKEVMSGGRLGHKKGYLSSAVLLHAPMEGWRAPTMVEDIGNGHGVITIDVRPVVIEKLTKDLRTATATLSPNAVRYLVDFYYATQAYRIRLKNQITALDKAAEPHNLLDWLHKQIEGLEGEVKKSLDTYSMSIPIGIRMRQIPGIGPVLASGLLAHLKIEKAPTAGHFWSFAGIAYGQVWEKGQKRPWNASLKRLMYLVEESFVWVQSKPDDVYGKLFRQRKDLETRANDPYHKFYADQAAHILATKKLGKDTLAYEAYSQGMLPKEHIHRRACRIAGQRFLSDLQAVWWELEYNEPARLPWIIEVGGHTGYRPPPSCWYLDGEGPLPRPAGEPYTYTVYDHRTPHGEPHIAHDTDVIQATQEHWDVPREGRAEPPWEKNPNHPYTTLYIGLEQLLIEFESAVKQLESLQITTPTLSSEERVQEVLHAYVPEAARPSLEERLRRFEAGRDAILHKSEAQGETDHGNEA